jgi:hypothetical protein
VPKRAHELTARTVATLKDNGRYAVGGVVGLYRGSRAGPARESCGSNSAAGAATWAWGVSPRSPSPPPGIVRGKGVELIPAARKPRARGILRGAPKGHSLRRT